jgi:pimeloyl-ACP methyl ester carboxylesterase
MAGPTVVLVHGAFADASSWRPLYERLAGDGRRVLAPPNPLRGLQADAAYIGSVIDELDGPVILVGHSYGGAVMTVAGVSPRVAGLVYVAGFAPDEGETLNALQARFPAPPLMQAIRPAQRPDGSVDLSIAPAVFHEVFCADLAAPDAAFMAIAQRPLAAAAFDETASAAAWRTKPSWAVLPTADEAINPDLHRFAYDRTGSTVTEVRGASHVVMTSQPDRVAGVVRQALAACAGAPVGT